MPLDPDTGLHQPSQGNRFPNGVFGGALEVNNARIAQQLADQQQSRRFLNDQLLEMSVEDKELDLADEVKLRQRRDEEFTRQDGFRRWVAEHPNATNEDLFKQSVVFNSPHSGAIGTLAGKDVVSGDKEEDLKVKRGKELRLEVTTLQGQGFTGPEIAPMVQAKYPEPEFADYIQKVQGLRVSPTAQAGINQKTGAAANSNAHARLADRTTPGLSLGNGTDSIAKLEKAKLTLLAQRQAAEAAAASLSNQVEAPDVVKTAKQRIDAINANLAKVESDLAAAKGETSPKTTPVNPSPASVVIQPPKFQPVPAPGEKDNTTGNVTLSDGTVVPAIVRGGMWHPK